MGIFSKNQDICVKEKDLKNIVTNYNKVTKIKINSKLIVPDNYEVVIGKKGKTLDLFCQGEHYLSYSNLPITCRKFGFDRVVKGSQKREMSANFYFVSKQVFAGKFETYKNVEMGTKAYGFYKTKAQGVYSYIVKDSKEFMQSLLNEYDYIKTGEAEKLLEAWTSEFITKELERNNFILSDVVANSPVITEKLKTGLAKFFSVAGLELLEFKITRYKLPKAFQEESNKNIQNQLNFKTLQEIEGDSSETTDNSDVKFCESEISVRPEAGEDNIGDKSKNGDVDTKQDEYETFGIEQDVMQAHELLKEFGIIKDEKDHNENETQPKSKNEEAINEITELKNKEVLEDEASRLNNDSNESNINYVPFGDFVIERADADEKYNSKNKAKEKTFVDLNLTELYTTKENTKRCLNCGTENNYKANHCILCGENFNEGEI